MANIFEEYKAQFRKQDNSLNQLILINITVFVLINTLGIVGSEIITTVDGLLALPKNLHILLVRPWTLITYMFHHQLFTLGGLGHLFSNMLALWFFGKSLKGLIDNQRFTSIYILGGLFAAAIFLITHNFLPYYSSQNVSGLVGASASVYAISVALVTISPRYGYNIPLIGRIEVRYIVLTYIVISFLSLNVKTGNAGGNVAHLGGAFLGWVYIKSLQNGTDLGKWIHQIIPSFKRLFLPSPKMKVSHSQPNNTNSSNSTSFQNTNTQEKIDIILDKIKVSGYSSLTKDEKQVLFDASE